MITIHPITGPIGFLQRYQPFIKVAGWVIFLLASVFIFLIVRRIVKNRPAAAIYPDDTALKRLEDLKSAHFKKEINEKDLFSNSADILREYIEKRYGIKASTMTTLQFIEKVSGTREISQENIKNIISLFKKKDGIKFAAEDINLDEAQAAAEFVKKFVNNTKEER